MGIMIKIYCKFKDPYCYLFLWEWRWVSVFKLSGVEHFRSRPNCFCGDVVFSVGTLQCRLVIIVLAVWLCLREVLLYVYKIF